MSEALTGSLGGITGNLQGTLNSFGGRLQQWVDSVFPPEKRNQAVGFLAQFASDKPGLASFLTSQIALSGPPLALFMIATISIGCFALLVGIILGLLGALAFIVTVAGFGLIFLFPTLLITIGFATFIWLWGWATYYILKHFNEKDIPGIHKPLGDGVAEQAGVKDQVDMIKGDKDVPEFPEKSHEEEGEDARKDAESKATAKSSGGGDGHGHGKSGGGGEKKEQNGSAGSHAAHPKKAVDAGKNVTDKAQGVTGKAQGAAGGATGAVSGAKSAVPVG